MIFLTVGTTKFPFTRLLELADNTLISLDTKEKVIAQIGSNKYNFRYKNIKIYSEIPFNKFMYYVSHSRIIISHAGCGTVLSVLKYSKNKPIIIPRCADLKEQVDNHQIFYSSFLKRGGYANICYPINQADKKLLFYIKNSKPLKNKRSNKLKKLTNKLMNYMENLNTVSQK